MYTTRKSRFFHSLPRIKMCSISTQVNPFSFVLQGVKNILALYQKAICKEKS
uniref:Uncharacterized protein n=1 Tax=Anguilla anguilla TaxID=7936 RepID=A0A0E9XGB2_ANGAN